MSVLKPTAFYGEIVWLGRVGVAGVPAEWRSRHRDWPWSLANLVALRRPPLLAWPAVFARNLAFFAVVLGHVVRRLLPPW